MVVVVIVVAVVVVMEVPSGDASGIGSVRGSVVVVIGGSQWG